jgi:hypothetical protein
MKKWANLAAAVDAPIAFLFAFEHQWQRTTDMADSLSIGESCPASIFSKLLPQEQSGGEAAAAGEVIYPAVGRLIFASCQLLTQRTGSHLFDSPRPCPHSRLGSRSPKGGSHNALEGWPPHPIRFTSCRLSESCSWQVSVVLVLEIKRGGAGLGAFSSLRRWSKGHNTFGCATAPR